LLHTAEFTSLPCRRLVLALRDAAAKNNDKLTR